MGEAKRRRQNEPNYGKTSKQLQGPYLNFVQEVLQVTGSSRFNPLVVYPLLAANLDKLDDNFAQELRQWATATISNSKPKEAAQALAVVIGYFSNLIQEFPLGDKDSNLEIAITGYEVISKVYTREALPKDWATVQNNLAAAYSKRIRGDKAENLEKAIAACQAAFQVRTLSAFRYDWAMTQTVLGSVYAQRIHGDRAENLEQAISCFKRVLQVYTRNEFPKEWSKTQSNLGNAYRNRIVGERAENLELAIAAYKAALQVRSFDATPEQWATTQMNLGNAYNERINGERAENLELAIATSEAALQVYTQQSFPEQWAMLHNNLALAYNNRIYGNKSENLDKARRYSQAALQIVTRNALPERWAQLQNTLGLVYSNQEQTSEAIECFQSALEIWTPTTFPHDSFTGGNNMGNIAFNAGLWSKAIEGYSVAIEAVETSRSWSNDEFRRQEILAQAIQIYAAMVQACINNGQLDKAIKYVERSKSKRLVDLMASNDLYQGGEIPLEVEEYLHQYENLQREIDRIRYTNNADNSRELSGVEGRTRSRAGLEADNETIQALEAEKQQVWQKLRRLDPVLAGEIQISAPNLAAMQKLIDKPSTAILSFYTTGNNTHIFVLRLDQLTCHSCSGQGIYALQLWILQNWLHPYVENNDEWHNNINQFLTELAQRLQLTDLITQHLTGIEELIIVPHLYLHQIPFAALPIGNNQYLGDKFLIRYTPSCQVLEFCQNRPPLEDSLTYGTVEDARDNLPCANFEGEQIAKLHDIPDSRRLKGCRQATVSNYRQMAKQVQVIHSSHHARSRLDNPLESELELGDGSITLGQLMTPGWRLPQLSDVFLSCCETGLGMTEITDDILTLSTGFLCAGARSVVSTLWSVDDLATALFSIFYYRYREGSDLVSPDLAKPDRPAALRQAQQKLRTLTGDTLATEYKPQLVSLLKQKLKEADALRQQAKKERDAHPQGSSDFKQWDEEFKQREKLGKRIFKTLKSLDTRCQEPLPFAHPCYWAAFTCSGLR